MAVEDERRTAAIVAVLMQMRAQGEDESARARQPGAPWSQDHRRTMVGQASLMHARASRSPWR